jgi:hypothetical protein
MTDWTYMYPQNSLKYLTSLPGNLNASKSLCYTVIAQALLEFCLCLHLNIDANGLYSADCDSFITTCNFVFSEMTLQV